MNYRKFVTLTTGMFLRVFDLILPPRCPLSGEIVSESGAISPQSWAALTFVSSPYCTKCGAPFQVVEGPGDALSGLAEQKGQVCGECLLHPKQYSMSRSVFVYDDASKPLVLAFKHGDRTYLQRNFAPLMRRALADIVADQDNGGGIDYIVPVPLHWSRLVRRRYNQAALLSRALLARALGAGDLESIGGIGGIGQAKHLPDCLIRLRATQPQGHKSYIDRAKNVHNAFAVHSKYRQCDVISGKRVLLVDDVYTTGATLNECTKALFACGARRVDVVTLARAVKTN